MVEFQYEELLKGTEDFSRSRLIGKGSHGSVYKCVLEDNKLVAVKKSSVSITHQSSNYNEYNSNKLENEISVLSSLHENPYTIKLLGTCQIDCLTKNRKILVMEYMPNGSLYDLLHVSSSTALVSWPKRVEIAIRIARAVQLLHEEKPSVIHRDIKSANVLFDSNWNAKLSDFGLAVFQAGSSSNMSCQPAGTIGYLDPCYTMPSKLSTSVDVHSFGVVLLEIISGRKAIDVNKDPASIVDLAVHLTEKQRVMEICDLEIEMPAFMEGTIRQFLHLAARCVCPKQEDRPLIGEIVMEMERSHLVIEQVGVVPSWIGLIRSVLAARRRRKLDKKWKGKKCAGDKHDDVHRDMANGKLLLREILADIAQN